MKHTSYFGIVLGAFYGILIRLLGGIATFNDFYSIYSITFIWVTPVIIGLIPILFSSNQLYRSRSRLFFYPVLTVLLFGFIALCARLEDFLCITILSFPFLLVAGLTGLLLGMIIKKNKTSKKLYSIILLPLLLNPIENLLPNKSEYYSVEHKVIIHENNCMIWKNIIEVPEIKDSEYNYGFFNYIGVPRPIKSAMEKKDGILYRVGYFTDNLKLYETIDELQEYRFVNFKMHIDKSQLRDKPTDRHLLKGDYFKFENISYRLNPINKYKTEVILRCEYRIESKMNGYANFWASQIIKDFEIRLLASFKSKIEGDLR